MQAHVSLVVFSKDRPMQLYAMLESVKKCIIGLDDVYVLYHAKNDAFQHGYDIVFNEFYSVLPGLCDIRQNRDNPKSDFKHLLCNQIMPLTHSNYVLFSTDDIIVTDFIDCGTCVEHLEKTGSYGFYLRLGKNITYNYMRNQHGILPKNLYHMKGDVYKWTFNHKLGYWAYPNTVDMTIYRKKDIEQTLQRLDFNSPNQLEGNWASQANDIKDEYGLCFDHSCMINIPVNLVQVDFMDNRNEGSYTVEELLEQFFNDKKIDIDRFYKVDNNASHMPYEFTFVNR